MTLENLGMSESKEILENKQTSKNMQFWKYVRGTEEQALTSGENYKLK